MSEVNDASARNSAWYAIGIFYKNFDLEFARRAAKELPEGEDSLRLQKSIAEVEKSPKDYLEYHLNSTAKFLSKASYAVDTQDMVTRYKHSAEEISGTARALAMSLLNLQALQKLLSKQVEKSSPE